MKLGFRLASVDISSLVIPFFMVFPFLSVLGSAFLTKMAVFRDCVLDRISLETIDAGGLRSLSFPVSVSQSLAEACCVHRYGTGACLRLLSVHIYTLIFEVRSY